MSVKATSSDTAMAKAMVTPKEYMNRPTMPPMNATGRNTAISDRLVASTARPTSWVPSMAASRGDIFFSSMKRKMFSSTTTASSITMPTASVRASSVMTLSVKSMYFMAAKVAISELGMATAEISVGRKRRRKRQTMKAAKSEPATRCSLTASTAATMNFDWSRTISAFHPFGSCGLSSS